MGQLFPSLTEKIVCCLPQHLENVTERWYSNSMLFVNVGLPTFQELLRRYIFGFRCRIECSDNTLIACINERNRTNPSTLIQLWNKLLNI